MKGGESQSVPKVWSRFQYIAEELIRDRKLVEVKCTVCGDLDPGELHTEERRGQPGLEFFRLLCPAGHVLFAIKTVHLQLAQDTQK